MVVSLLATAACGEAEFHYVTNQTEQTYFKVPSAWQEVPSADMVDGLFGLDPTSGAAQSLRTRRWTVVYDAADSPTAGHLFTDYPTPDPIAFSMVLHLSEAAQGQVSLDWLRDLLLPVTEASRQATVTSYQQQVQQILEQGGNPASVQPPLTGFEQLFDQVLTPEPGLSGVRVVYNYMMASQVLHTYDYTALVNNDKTVIYLLLLRCTASCYRERAVELNDIATSFTVRSDT